MDGTIDFSLLPEIRYRLNEVEKPFITFAGVGPHGAVFGLDLLLMKEKLSAEAFRNYLEASRELKRIEGFQPTSANATE